MLEIYFLIWFIGTILTIVATIFMIYTINKQPKDWKQENEA